MKKYLLTLFVGLILILLLPALLVTVLHTDNVASEPNGQAVMKAVHKADDVQEPTVSITRSETNESEELAFEEYIIGVVAAEMPASYEEEALKAQAVAARTYFLRQLLDGQDVTDTTAHQVFKDEAQLRETWGNEYDTYYTKIQHAVIATQGEVLTYEGEPIVATFFSTSSGKTENAEDYWGGALPYLRSVTSDWDSSSPKYEKVYEVSHEEVASGLGVSVGGRISALTEGGAVAEFEIGGKTLTGREVREKLGLDSSAFEWVESATGVTITTRGWGHGVGMSQYGANQMALDGQKYETILHHYYSGVVVEDGYGGKFKN
ncbi:stage II sporulation protein D [Paenalkalicoccus suaedae]|uniref:Stage II sporulation protein D n=1 Tax=Paenalkalicoccus suaedae TaxID=2592382 RepID=A0A859FKN4_9BACI|nr:stage II sporulation protein D [Paenalkalicoccus suaedae]